MLSNANQHKEAHNLKQQYQGHSVELTDNISAVWFAFRGGFRYIFVFFFTSNGGYGTT